MALTVNQLSESDVIMTLIIYDLTESTGTKT